MSGRTRIPFGRLVEAPNHDWATRRDAGTHPRASTRRYAMHKKTRRHSQQSSKPNARALLLRARFS
jgi:hypothetical protein